MMCQRLLAGGAPGLHMYTLNLERSAGALKCGCGLCDGCRAVEPVLATARIAGLLRGPSALSTGVYATPSCILQLSTGVYATPILHSPALFCSVHPTPPACSGHSGECGAGAQEGGSKGGRAAGQEPLSATQPSAVPHATRCHMPWCRTLQCHIPCSATCHACNATCRPLPAHPCPVIFPCSCLHYRSALAVPADAGCCSRSLLPPSACPCSTPALPLSLRCVLPLLPAPSVRVAHCNSVLALSNACYTHRSTHVKRRAGQQQHSQEGTGSMLGSCRAASLPVLQRSAPAAPAHSAAHPLSQAPLYR